MTSRSALRNWLLLLSALLLIALALWGLPAWQAAQAERQRQAQEAIRLAEAQRILNSDPVKFQVYVRQVGVAAQVIGDGLQDASGPCANVSGFENGVKDPPPETKTCIVTDTGAEPPTVKLVLKDGRVFRWPDK